jgi:subtilase family serine protease
MLIEISAFERVLSFIRRLVVTLSGAGLLFGLVLTSTAAPAPLASARGTRGAVDGVTIHPMASGFFVSTTQPPTEAECVARFTVPCYDPAQMQTAYNEQPLFNRGVTGRGETIVIVDAFGSPTIQSDLTMFDAQFGLPAPPSFKIITPAGPLAPYDPTNTNGDVTWAGEATLDVEWSHTMAPEANIVLVETPVAETEGTAGFPQIVEAENYVIDHHLGDVISQSFAATEQTFPNAFSLLSLRSAYINAYNQGITVLAGTGDTAAANYSNVAGTSLFTYPTVDWPASDPLVTAVGGTQLSLDAAGQRTEPDQVWNDTYDAGLQAAFGATAATGPIPLSGGGGLSSVFPRPWYQNGVANVVGDQRGVPDISMSAACSGMVDTYESFEDHSGADGWYVNCGTSEATPLFAGVVALADQVAGHPLGLINPALYQLSAEHAPGLVDVTTGNNTVTFLQNNQLYTVRGNSAGPGYDLASGVGTINAAYFVPELAQTAGGFIGAGPNDNYFGPQSSTSPWD